MLLLKHYLMPITIPILLFSAAASGYWEEQSSGTSAFLLDVYFDNPDEGWAVGSVATILHTVNGGQEWTEQDSPAFATFESISFINSDTGWVVGDLALVHTTDGGDNWTKVETGISMHLSAVHFIDAGEGWLCGGQNVYPSGAKRGIFHTTDGGQSWSTQLYETLELPFTDIFFADSLTGCAVGELGAIFVTSDGGSTWLDRSLTATGHLNEVFFISPSTGFIAGNDGLILKTSDGGMNWSELPSGTTDYIGGIHFIDEYSGWAVGGSNDSCLVLGTYDGGTSWNQYSCSVPHLLSSVFFTDYSNGWAVGPYGVIVHTPDGGGMGIEEDSEQAPFLGISPFHPNPSFSEVSASFTSAAGFPLSAEVHDLSGRAVRVLHPSYSTQGSGTVTWDGRSEDGFRMPPGIYIIVLSGNGGTASAMAALL